MLGIFAFPFVNNLVFFRLIAEFSLKVLGIIYSIIIIKNIKFNLKSQNQEVQIGHPKKEHHKKTKII